MRLYPWLVLVSSSRAPEAACTLTSHQLVRLVTVLPTLLTMFYLMKMTDDDDDDDVEFYSVLDPTPRWAHQRGAILCL